MSTYPTRQYRAHMRVASILMSIACVGTLTACTVASGQSRIYSGSDPAQSQSPEPTESAAPGLPKTGFIDTSAQAPVVTREGELPADKRLVTTAGSFTSPVAYSDGLRLTTSEFSRGTVKEEGAGIITGAPYIVFTITLENASTQPVDLSAVVVTLKYGPGATVAAALYDEVQARDFYGTVDAGASQTALYAFQIPESQADATLYVDLDGAHSPAQFTGTLPE